MRSVLVNLHTRRDDSPVHPDTGGAGEQFPHSPQVLAVLGGAEPSAVPGCATVLVLTAMLGQAHQRRWSAVRRLAAPGITAQARTEAEHGLATDTDLAAALVTAIDALARTSPAAVDGDSVGAVLSAVAWWWTVSSHTDAVVGNCDESFRNLFGQCGVYNVLVDAIAEGPRR